MIIGMIYAHRRDTPQSKRCSFRSGIFMFFFFVPFMLGWNLYGNLMIKSDYFKVGGVDGDGDYY
jgi:hypothetical protein